MKHFIFTLFALFFMMGAINSQKVSGTLSNVKQLTQDAAKYENPQWSPDGKMIAFTNEGHSGLLVMNRDGANKRVLSTKEDVGYAFQWSIDSEDILVRDARWDDNGRHRAIWSVSLAGKEIRMSEDAPYMQPAAWVYTQDGSKRAKVVDGKALPLQPLKVKAEAKAELAKLELKPSFNHSFFAQDNNLFLVDGNGKKTLLSDVELFCPVFSPDGTKIAFNRGDDVCVMNIDGTSKRVLARGFFPSWVNDNQIVFERTTDDGHVYTSGHLFIMDMNGKNQKQLTVGDDIYRYPAVSPDGKSIVFTKANTGQIFTADLQ